MMKTSPKQHKGKMRRASKPKAKPMKQRKGY